MAKELSNMLVNRIHDQHLQRFASRYLHGRLIDIGCGNRPYASMLAPFVTAHVGVDHAGTAHDLDRADLVGTAYALPVPDASFDSALCTAVLEHLEEPEAALRECHRVLKPGGIALYSVPFIWHLHEEPRDFFRFSRHGLGYLFGKVGFEVVVLKPLSGFWVTFGQLLVYNLYRHNRWILRRLRLMDLLALVVQGAAYGLDRLDRAEEWTWMYMVVARKPLAGA